MPITKEFLEAEIASLQAQRNNALTILQQADGAIAAYRALLSKLEQPEPDKGAEQ